MPTVLALALSKKVMPMIGRLTLPFWMMVPTTVLARVVETGKTTRPTGTNKTKKTHQTIGVPTCSFQSHSRM